MQKAALIAFAHFTVTVVSIGTASFYQLARGQHGGAPTTLLEGAANAIGVAFMFPLALLCRLALPSSDVLWLVALVLNSALVGFVAAKILERRGRTRNVS